MNGAVNPKQIYVVACVDMRKVRRCHKDMIVSVV
jgi:hypothetical protein